MRKSPFQQLHLLRLCETFTECMWFLFLFFSFYFIFMNLNLVPVSLANTFLILIFMIIVSDIRSLDWTARYLLNSGVSPVEDSDAQLQGRGHHGTHFTWWERAQHWPFEGFSPCWHTHVHKCWIYLGRTRMLEGFDRRQPADRCGKSLQRLNYVGGEFCNS